MHLPFKTHLWSLSGGGRVLDVLYELFGTVNTLKPSYNFCHSQLCAGHSCGLAIIAYLESLELNMLQI